VATIILHALPWTIGLLLTTTLIAFLLGTVLGALSVWRGAPRIFLTFVPLFMILSAVPFYLFGLTLIYVFATVLQWLPLGGGMGIRSNPSISISFAIEIVQHSILPATSILLASIGIWALSMRGMMVTVQGEDYMTYAEALGLGARRRFLHFGLRNAILPQITLLALSLGHVLSGSILVELVFGYPGVGQQLFRAIQNQDYFVIYGIVFVLICAIALAMVIVDFINPFLDPRLRHVRRAG
jgi:peptide/nickel transport system permease protein